MQAYLILLAVAAVFLLAFLLFRTAVLSRDETPFTPAVLDEVDAAGAGQRLARLIQCKTVSTISLEGGGRASFPAAQELARLHKTLEELYPLAHRCLRREVLAGYSLLYTWPGSEPGVKPVLILAHQDVVPVEEGSEASWEAPPFSGKISGGYIWGRGTLDFKCGMAAALEGVEGLLRAGFQPRRTVCLAFGHDEEIGGLKGAHQIALALQRRGATFENVLDEGCVVLDGLFPGVKRPAALVGLTEKGYLNLEVTAESAHGHAALLGKEPAVSMLCRALNRIEEAPMQTNSYYIRRLLTKMAPAMPFGMRLLAANGWLFGGMIQKRLSASANTNTVMRTTAAVTMLQAGVKDNVLPRQARALINLRLFPGDSIPEVIAHVQRAAGDKHIQLKPVPASGDAENLPGPGRAAGHRAGEAGAPLQMAVPPGESLRGGGWESPPASDPHSRSFAILEETIQQVFPEAVVVPFLSPAATDSRHYAGLSDNIFRFQPVKLKVADLGRIHGENERIAVEDYARMVQFSMRWIRNCDELD